MNPKMFFGYFPRRSNPLSSEFLELILKVSKCGALTVIFIPFGEKAKLYTCWAQNFDVLTERDSDLESAEETMKWFATKHNFSSSKTIIFDEFSKQPTFDFFNCDALTDYEVEQYAEFKRKILLKNFKYYADFLRSLQLRATIFTSLSMDNLQNVGLRAISHLLLNANNFFLGDGVDYSTDIMEKIQLSSVKNEFILMSDLGDKFNYHGLSSVMYVKLVIEGKRRVAEIKSWIIADNLTERKVENAIFEELIRVIREKKVYEIIGYYKAGFPSPPDFFMRFGFKFCECKDGLFKYSFVIPDYIGENKFIKVKNECIFADS